MEDTNSFNWNSFHEFPVVGILRGFTTRQVERIGKTCFEAGLTNLEVTLNTKDASEQISLLREIAPANVNIGAGTVLDEAGLQTALAAGANFIVSPITHTGLIRSCVEQNIPIMPGAYTPSEVHLAWQTGAPLVKLFPANLGGPQYLKSVLAPLDQVELIAVGGVNLSNFSSYLKSGAAGVGIGSPFFNRKKIESEDWEWLQEQVKAFLKVFQSFKKAKTTQ